MFDIYAFWHLWCCYNIFFHNYSKTRDKQIFLCWVMMWLLTKPEQKLVGLWLTMSEMALISDWWEFEPHYCDTETKTRSTMNNRIYLCKISPCNNFFLPFYLKLPVEILSLSAHQNRVSDMVFSLESEWLVSTGHDKSVSWMCTQSGSMLGRHYFNAWASCLQYPSVWDIQFQLWAPSPSDVFFNIHLLLKPWLSPSDTITTHSTPLWVITQDRSRCWNWKSRPTPPSPPWRVTKVKYSFGYHACDRVQIIKYAALAVFSCSSHLFVNCKWEKKKSTRKILVTWQKMNKMGQICIQGLQSSCCHIAKKVNPPGKIGCHGYATPGNKQTNTALFFSSSLLEQGNRGVLWPHDHLRTSHACCMM